MYTARDANRLKKVNPLAEICAQNPTRPHHRPSVV